MEMSLRSRSFAKRLFW